MGQRMEGRSKKGVFSIQEQTDGKTQKVNVNENPNGRSNVPC
jgi:hypothetical protein